MEEKLINLKIDNVLISVPAGTTIMDAAETLGIHIPRLCYHPDLSLHGSCRVCIVEVEGVPFYMASCSVEVWEGMEVLTNSPAIREARRDIIELLIDNHPKECQTCERDGICELQNLAYSHGVRERLFEGKRKKFPIEKTSKSVIKDSEKCILCGRCVRVCDEVQGVTNLSQHGRGFETVVTPGHGKDMDDSACIQCGQCINVCPTAAFLEQNHTEAVWKALSDPEMHVIAQVAPSVRAVIGEGFGMEPGTYATGKMVTAIKRLGFDMIFDTDFTADLTIMEEATELIGRLNGEGGPLPMLTSCSPGWVNFLEKFYPEMIPHASSCMSPMTMLSSLTKTYYADKYKIDPDKIFIAAVMPCVAKKYEMARPDFMLNGKPLTDAVLTSRELIWMIKCYGIDFEKLPDSDFDAPMGIASGAGDIFGATGGVMEAALRTAYEVISGKPLEDVDIKVVREAWGLKEAEIEIGDKKVKVAVANGLTNAKTILDKVKNKEDEYHLIEVMACPGGCIGGGGQPYPPTGDMILDQELLKKRAQGLYNIDAAKQLRKSHENPAIKKLYEEFLEKPGRDKSHKLLHTSYTAKLPRGIK